MPFKRSSRPRRKLFSGKRRGTAWDWNGYAGVADPGGLYWDWMILPAIPESELRSSTNLGYEQLREDFTLVKTIIDLVVQAAQPTTQPDTFYIGLHTFESSDPTTVPTINEIPQAGNGSEEWIWRQAMTFPKNTFGSTIVTIGSLLDPNKSIVRGMRKLGADMGILVVVDTQSCSVPMSFNAEFRFLLKKPK